MRTNLNDEFSMKSQAFRSPLLNSITVIIMVAYYLSLYLTVWFHGSATDSASPMNMRTRKHRFYMAYELCYVLAKYKWKAQDRNANAKKNGRFTVCTNYSIEHEEANTREAKRKKKKKKNNHTAYLRMCVCVYVLDSMCRTSGGDGGGGFSFETMQKRHSV